MRWLIVGPYPPSGAPGEQATLAAARLHLAAGDLVTVISPEPSAADAVADVAGLSGIVRLRTLLRHHDALWLRLGDGVGPTPHASQATVAAERVALGAALRSVSEAVVDVSDLTLMPGGRVGNRVLRSGARFVVDDEGAAATLVSRGAPASSVTVRAPLPRSAFDEHELSWSSGRVASGSPQPTTVPAVADRVQLEAWVAANAHRPVEPASVVTGLRALPSLALPEPPSGAKRAVGRAVLKLTRWMLDPIVAHVNRLQAAFVEAIERTDD